MKMNRRGRSSVTAVLLVLALLFGTVLLAGCGGTVESPGGPSGTGANPSVTAVPDSVRGEVLDTLKSMGATFDPTVVTVAYGESDTHIIVRGPVTGPNGLGTKKVGSAATATTSYSQIDLDLSNGAWKVSATK